MSIIYSLVLCTLIGLLIACTEPIETWSLIRIVNGKTDILGAWSEKEAIRICKELMNEEAAKYEGIRFWDGMTTKIYSIGHPTIIFSCVKGEKQ